MIVATLQICGKWASEKDDLNMDSNSWRAKGPSGLRNEGGMLSGPPAFLPFIFLMADSNSSIWSGAQLSSSTEDALRQFLSWLLVDVTIRLWYVEFADPDLLVYEDVSFFSYEDVRFDISDGSTVAGHCIIRRVGIRSIIQTLNEFPNVWAIWIQHCILRKIFLTFCLGLVDNLLGFMTSIDPLLSI